MSVIEFRPQPGPQAALLSCPLADVFFGGARGGGKTMGMLLDWVDHALEWGQHAIGMFVRKVFKNLEELIAAAHRILPHFGGRWLKGDATYVFEVGPAKGARLKFRHIATVEDADAYQGHEYTWLCVEEITQFANPVAIDMLSATLRSSFGVKCMFRATGNPGGAGHNWIKARYVSPAPRGYKPILDRETGEHRVFIPSRLDDNQILMKSDPKYEHRLRRVGSPSLVKAWRWGDWDIVAGGFFDDLWDPGIHVLRPFEIPGSWTRRRSFDWGSTKPGSLGQWAISDGTQPVNYPVYFPRGSAIRFAEWYTCQTGDDGLVIPNTGLKLSNQDLGHGIADRSRNFNWNGCVADPSIFTEAGGPSIMQQMNEGARKTGRSLVFRGADNTRVAGWQRVREYLQAAQLQDRERPGMYVFENCTDFIRTVPVLQMDKNKADDIDTEAEDHIADETRYFLMSLSAAGGVGGATKMPVKGR